METNKYDANIQEIENTIELYNLKLKGKIKNSIKILKEIRNIYDN